MRKILVATALLFFAGNAFAQGIDGSAHDFFNGIGSDYAATGNGADEICAYCHTPHGANTAVQPLWNKDTLTTKEYTAYGTTLAGTVIDNQGVPSGLTRLCLGCHDGSVAPGEVANPPNAGWTDNTDTITGDALLNTDFSDDHPVGFTYQDSLDKNADVPDPLPSTYPLNGGEFECSSCHDVHNEAGFAQLLVVDNDASAMCQDCHQAK